MTNKLSIKAEGDFKFQFFIEKAVPGEEDGMMTITGIASTVNIDHDNERMAKDALVSMANIINEKSVPLRMEHQKTDNAICGQVFKAWLDERNQLWVKANLDPANPASPILYKGLKEGMKLGLSVGGRVKRALQEFSEKTGKMVKTFYDVVLDEVSVTQRPANYDAWLFAKSIATKGEDTSRFYDTPFYRQFLFENQQLDYIQAFAKSIPDGAWQKVELPLDITTKNIEDMNKAETKDTETKPTEETTKYASVADVEALKGMMAKGFEALTSVVAKLAKDYSREQTTDHPDTPEAKKAREGQETGAETGGQHSSETDPGVEATANKAETDVTSEETKPKVGATASKGMEKDMHVHLHEGDEKSDTGTDTEKTESETGSETGSETDDKKDKKPYGAEYQMKSVLKRLGDISKGMTIKMSDSSETDTKEDTKTEKSVKSAPEMDLFVAAITEVVEKMAKKLEDKGYRVPGFEKSIADMIQKSPELQAEIQKMLKEPGLKKSVSLGVPFMVTKEGKRFALVAQDLEVKKSQDEQPKSFKEMYKSEFGSIK